MEHELYVMLKQAVELIKAAQHMFGEGSGDVYFLENAQKLIDRYDQTPHASTDEMMEVIEDHHRLTRELDLAINGVEGAAPQASLCDIVAQVRREGFVRKAQPAIIRGEILEAGMVDPESDNGYNRVNVAVPNYRHLAAYPRNLFKLQVVIMAADDYADLVAP